MAGGMIETIVIFLKGSGCIGLVPVSANVAWCFLAGEKFPRW